MTILLVITVPELGGAQRHVRDLMAGLKDRVRFLLATSGTGWLVEQAHTLGIPVIPLNFHRTRLGWRDLVAVLRLVNVIRNNEVTFVHCHSTKAGVIGRLAALLAQRPCVYTVHGFAFKDRRFPWIARALLLSIEWILGKTTSKLITVDRADYHEAFRLRIVALSRLHFVPNGIDVPERPPETRHADTRFTVGTMARLIKGKGVEDLLDAIHLLSPLYPNINLFIAGDGPSRKTLEDRAQRSGLQKQVQFLGWVEDVDEFFAGIDVFALPSWKEGTPYALLDAMARGKAIVATSVGGIPEMLDGGSAGLIVHPRDVTALATSISSFVADPSQRDLVGSKAYSIVRERYRRDEMLRRTHAVYCKASYANESTEDLPRDGVYPEIH